MAYKSPIDLIQTQISNAVEDAVYKAVLNVNVKVDKDELLKALSYDRGQYLQGYKDRDSQIVRCRDCKHSVIWYGDKSRCFLWHEHGIDVLNDGFCNHGEREEADD